jgi:uncharacterized protein YndB with AHSA1/START domain
VTDRADANVARATVVVEAPTARAFDVFTSGFDGWWPRTHKIGGADLSEAVLEPRVGGRWYERDVDGSECEWGRVLAYEPPTRLVLAWQIDGRWRHDPDFVTEVEVRFVAEGPDRTRVELEHRDLDRFGDAQEEIRSAFQSPGGWRGLLEAFAAAVASPTRA